jgi:hypothetical protein
VPEEVDPNLVLSQEEQEKRDKLEAFRKKVAGLSAMFAQKKKEQDAERDGISLTE